MILAALCDLYERLLADPDSGVARPGYTESSAVAVLEISREGCLVRAVPLGTQKGKRVVGLGMTVPERVKRSAGSAANFLCDSAEYVLGAQVTTAERAEERLRMCVELHDRILAGVSDHGARAVNAFLSEWDPDRYADEPRLKDVREACESGGNIVFRLEGDSRFIHDRPAVMRAWEAHRGASATGAVMGQCLVTGEYSAIARLHKSISGIRGAQPTGASIVSFNFAAAESYGKEQGTNSPVSEKAVFSYGTALNWLTASERHRTLIGDTTAVFWAERAGPEEDLLLELFGMAMRPYEAAEGVGAAEAVDTENASSEKPVSLDEGSAGRVRSILERIVRGRPVSEETAAFDKEVRFFMLGLSPNAARVSIRFWHVNTFGGLLNNVSKHFEDMSVIHRDFERPVTVGRLLFEAAPASARKQENIPQVLVGSLMRSILGGTAYPQSMYSAIIGRIRVDADDPERPGLERKVSYPRVAYIKAHLRRKARITGDKSLEEVLTEVLNEENQIPGYLLGRLFALLEKAQLDANKGIKSTIKDRYYASASATPGAVFPVLIRLAQHHIAKSEHGGYVDKLIEGVMADIKGFPAHLNLDQQGMFALGYYQQKADLYKKRSEDEKKGGEDSEESR